MGPKAGFFMSSLKDRKEEYDKTSLGALALCPHVKKSFSDTEKNTLYKSKFGGFVSKYKTNIRENNKNF